MRVFEGVESVTSPRQTLNIFSNYTPMAPIVSTEMIIFAPLIN